MAWKIDYSETARKQLRKLDRQVARRILDFMDERISGQGEPRNIGQALAGPTVGSFWRYRVGDYRIICDIQDGALCILAIEIGNRREIYR